ADLGLHAQKAAATDKPVISSLEISRPRKSQVFSSEGEKTVRSVYGASHLRVARHEDGLLTHYVAPDFEIRDGVSVIYARVGNTRVARLESTEYAVEWLDRPEEELNAGAAYRAHLDGDSQSELWLAAAARRMLTGSRPSVVSLHHDHLGSVVMATGDESEPLGRRSFGVFGDISGQQGYVDRYGFTGQEHEPHTGFIHFAHRFLAPQTGQWLSPDPAFMTLTQDSQARLPEAVARYSYVLNNPGTLVDPNGLSIRRRIGNFFSRVFGRRGSGGSGAGGRGRAPSGASSGTASSSGSSGSSRVISNNPIFRRSRRRTSGSFESLVERDRSGSSASTSSSDSSGVVISNNAAFARPRRQSTGSTGSAESIETFVELDGFDTDSPKQYRASGCPDPRRGVALGGWLQPQLCGRYGR
ncbi:MAG: RHS repeat-associated core domain-containing protein, partial [Myxococcota bacterium]